MRIVKLVGSEHLALESYTTEIAENAFAVFGEVMEFNSKIKFRGGRWFGVPRQNRLTEGLKSADILK